MKERIGLFSPPSFDMTGREIIEHTAELGLSLLEPYPYRELLRFEPEQARALAAYARERGVRMQCFSTATTLAGPGADEALAELLRWVDVAAALGVPWFHHTLYCALDAAECTMPYDAVLHEVVPRARKVFDYAAQHGMRCLYEPQGLYFNGCEGFGKLLEAIDRPVGVVLDTGNPAFVGEQPDAFAERFADRIVHVHVKDYVLRPGQPPQDVGLGQGDIRLRRTLEILARHRYSGRYVLEYVAPGEEQRQSLAVLEQMLTELGTL